VCTNLNMQNQSHAKIVSALLGSAIIALIVTFILAAFTVCGMLYMSAANVFLWTVYGIFLVVFLAAAILQLHVNRANPPSQIKECLNKGAFYRAKL
jgi:ABC-type bacteriocin/lantibiotic exporter with double-glycine peptidase domain